MGNMQLLSSLPVFFIIISVVFYSLPPVSARSQSTQLQIHPYYDCDFQNDKVSSKDLNSTVSKVSARSQSSPPWHIDLETYLNFYKSTRPSLFHRTLGKTKNLVRLRSFPFTVPADLETYQNSAPETNQKHLSCDCYQISAQPRLSSSFSASLETLQKHLNYGIFRNVVLSTPCNTTRLFVRTTKKFSVLVEEQIETTMWIPLVLLMECGQMLWTIALDSGKCDDAHNVFWAVHGGDGKGFISEGKIQSVELWLVRLKGNLNNVTAEQAKLQFTFFSETSKSNV
ncbi:hypothetical protein Tco_1038362 [Tanacetum coccineum]